ncbi:Cell wall transcription factor ACE2 [Hyphodiscus hymeniophilus]|uniref:Cell wall transcription factor ACE2 n=1 Tax=Hyphodiscus hymeniophilus TaxID=353542 RepID=A0A9P6VNK9_9HELO|nr:Cell wall transcription factor ACE2 [Hyphodiscus hymeniophilus]
MDLTPQSRSPTSPFRYTSNSQPLYEYPSPVQSESRYRSTDSLQGLGLYSCQMPGSAVEEGGSVAQSSSATNSWPTTSSHEHRNTPRSTQSTPNILSAEYDPFAPFHPTVAVPYSNDIYTTQTSEVAVLPTSPVLSGNTSQRSSFSSAPASEIFTQPGSIQSYTPSIKMEEHTEYITGTDGMLLSSPQMSHSILVTSTSSYPGSLEATFYQDQNPLAWPKVDYGSTHDLPSISSLPIPSYGRLSESQDQIPPHEQRKILGTIARTRQPRKLTTKEDANFQCTVKGCGKLFGRSYNFKAHMETHDASREYPFPCLMKDCTKKFVRKTDLQRHHQSVHMKQRTHRCDYCSRHMEDGCAKRFDIETVDFRPQNYGNEDATRAAASRGAGNQSRQPSYSSSAHYSPPPGSTTSQGGPHDGSLTSARGAFLERQDYLTEDNTQDPVWSS